MNQHTPLAVAHEIQRQIGLEALRLLGAKGYSGGDNFLQFRISENPSRVSAIRVTLDASDTYTVQFIRRGKGEFKVLASVENIYCDQLHDVLEQGTGLYVSFKRR